MRRALEKPGALWRFSHDALEGAGARHGPPFALICSNTMDLAIGRWGLPQINYFCLWESCLGSSFCPSKHGGAGRRAGGAFLPPVSPCRSASSTSIFLLH